MLHDKRFQYRFQSWTENQRGDQREDRDLDNTKPVKRIRHDGTLQPTDSSGGLGTSSRADRSLNRPRQTLGHKA